MRETPGFRFRDRQQQNLGVPNIRLQPPQIQFPGQGQTELSRRITQDSIEASHKDAASNLQAIRASGESLATAAAHSGLEFPTANYTNDFAALAKAGTDIINVLNKTNEAKLKKQQEKANLAATVDAEQIRLSALDTISGPTGLGGYQSELQAFLQRNSGASSEHLASLVAGISSTGRDSYSTVHTRDFKAIEQQRQTYVAQQEQSVLQQVLIPNLSGLRSLDPTRQTQALNNTFVGFQQYIQNNNLDLESASHIALALQTEVNNSLVLTEQQKAEFANNTYGVLQSAQDYSDLFARRNELTPTQFAQQLQILGAIHNSTIPGGLDPNAGLNLVGETARLRTDTHRAILSLPENEAALRQAVQLESNLELQAALYFSTDIGKANLERHRTYLESVLPDNIQKDVFNQIDNYVSIIDETKQNGLALEQDYRNLREELAKFNSSSLQQQINLIMRLNSSDNQAQVLNSLGLSALASREESFQLDNLQNLAQQASQFNSLSEEQKLAFREELKLVQIQLNEEYQTQISAKEQELLENYEGMRALGLGDFVTDEAGFRFRWNDIDYETINNELVRVQTEVGTVLDNLYIPLQQPQGINTGGAGPPFVNPPLHQEVVEGYEHQVTLPIPPTASFGITGHLGDVRYNADGTTRSHNGADIALEVGTDIINYVSGQVIHAGWYDGYGYTVDIQGEDGYVHRFAHLSSINVAVGDRVEPGAIVALSGESGVGTGPHLHWEVRESQWGTALDPLQYSARIATSYPRSRGQTNPNQLQYNNVPLDNNLYLGGQGTYNNHNPVQSVYASINKHDYAWDVRDNFGYSYLAENADFRVKLHQTAQRLGIPTQWLADIMAYESGFEARIRNRGGSGATGLIQFMPSTAAWLLSGLRGYEIGEDTAIQMIQNMSGVEQLDLVYTYLEPMKDSFHSPYHVLMSIWGGAGNLDRLTRDPESVRYLSDGDITFEEYANKIGIGVGRQYIPLYDTGEEIHSSPYSGCPICTSMLQGGFFAAHVVE